MAKTAVLEKSVKGKNELTVRFMGDLKAKNPNEKEFHQAVLEVLESLQPVLEKRPEYRRHKILERLVEPEREPILIRLAPKLIIRKSCGSMDDS